MFYPNAINTLHVFYPIAKIILNRSFLLLCSIFFTFICCNLGPAKGRPNCESLGRVPNPWIWSQANWTQLINWVMSNAWNSTTYICVSKGWFTPWTMKSDHGRWPFSMVPLGGPTSMVLSSKNQFTKPLGPSLGVNRMWTKRNDHAPKVNVLIFF
jgi:hypothetical protein